MSQMFPRQPHEPDVVDWLTRKTWELITGKPVPRDDDDDDDHHHHHIIIPPI